MIRRMILAVAALAAVSVPSLTVAQVAPASSSTICWIDRLVVPLGTVCPSDVPPPPPTPDPAPTPTPTPTPTPVPADWQVITSKSTTNGVFKVPTGTTTNYEAAGKVIHTAYRVFETPTGSFLEGGSVHDMTADNLYRGFARIHGSHNFTFRNITATYKAAPATSMSVLPACIQEEGEHNMGGLLIDHVTCDGFQLVQSDPTAYGNGDGLNLDSQNPECSVTITNSEFRNSTDAGADVKCARNHLDNVYAHDNHRNFRLWHGTDSGTLTCGNSKHWSGSGGGACIWVSFTKNYPLHIRKLIVRQTNTVPIIVLDSPAQVIIDACDIQAPAGTPMVKGSKMAGSVLGPGCSIPAQ